MDKVAAWWEGYDSLLRKPPAHSWCSPLILAGAYGVCLTHGNTSLCESSLPSKTLRAGVLRCGTLQNSTKNRFCQCFFAPYISSRSIMNSFISPTIYTRHLIGVSMRRELPRPSQHRATPPEVRESACHSQHITTHTEKKQQFLYQHTWKQRSLPCFCAGMRMLLSFLDAALEHTPRPSSRACSGRLSLGWCWQVKPEPQRAVYTPHACPSPRAHDMQQPQPGSLTRSAQSFGSGLHSRSAPESQGSQRTTGPTVPASRTNAASAAARQSTQRPGILPIKLVTKGQYVSCHVGLRGLSVTQRAG